MSLEVKIDNFYGGMKGPEGQYRGDVKNSILHANNLIVERDGSLRNRPAVKDLNIKTLPHDRSVVFEFEGEIYTYVYDPYISMSFREVHPSDYPTSQEIIEDYGYFYNPDFSFNSAMFKNRVSPSVYSPQDQEFINLFSNPPSSPISQSTIDAFNEWILDEKAMHRLYLGEIINRAYRLQNEYFYIAINGEEWRGYNGSGWTSQSWSTPQDMFDTLKAEPWFKILRLGLNEGHSSAFYSRSLLYRREILVETNIYRPFPMDTRILEAERSGGQAVNFPEVRSLQVNRSGRIPWRQAVGVDETQDYSYRVEKGVNRIFLINPAGLLPPLVIDMHRKDANEFNIYDLRCQWMSPPFASDNQNGPRAGVLQMPSVLTLEEFNVLRSIRFDFFRPGFATGALIANDAQFRSERQTASNFFERNPITTEIEPSLRFGQIATDAPRIVPDNLDAQQVILDNPGRNFIHFRSTDPVTMRNNIDQFTRVGRHGFNVSLFYGDNYILMPISVNGVTSVFKDRSSEGSKETIPWGRDTSTEEGVVRNNFGIELRTPLSTYLSYYNPGFDLIEVGARQSSAAPYHGTGGVNSLRYSYWAFPFVPSYTDKDTFGQVIKRNHIDTSIVYPLASDLSLSGNTAALYSLQVLLAVLLDRRNFDPFAHPFSPGGWVAQTLRGDVQFTLRGNGIFGNYVHGINQFDFFTDAKAIFSRVLFFWPRRKRESLTGSSNTGVDSGIFSFNAYENILALSEDPLIKRGFLYNFSSEGGIEGSWTAILRGELQVGTTRGFVNLGENAVNVQGFNDATLTVEDNPSQFRPFTLFTATYQFLNDARTLYIIEESDELKRKQYRSYSSDISDYLREGLTKVHAIQDVGRIAILTNKRVFTGMVRDDGTIAWTELTFGADVIEMFEDRDILYIQTQEKVFSLDFKEFTPIEEGVEVSMVLPSPLAYSIKSDAIIPERLTQYEILKGHLIGEITKHAQIGSMKDPRQFTSQTKTSVQFGRVGLKDQDDAAKIEFIGRQVRISAGLLTIGGGV